MTDDWYHLQRKANPPGWTPPAEGSNYNPFDPHEKRPPQGYPSEFKTPGRESNWSTIPKDATQYQHMKTTMARLQYTPRPHSELYPGQFKTLRRVNNYTKFDKGVQLTGRWLVVGLVGYGIFVHRWNDGYENIFSDLYRSQLRFKYWLFGTLNDQEMSDLNSEPIFRRDIRVGAGEGIISDVALENGIALERPERRHYIEAERIMQQREEEALRAKDEKAKERKWW